MPVYGQIRKKKRRLHPRHAGSCQKVLLLSVGFTPRSSEWLINLSGSGLPPAVIESIVSEVSDFPCSGTAPESLLIERRYPIACIHKWLQSSGTRN